MPSIGPFESVGYSQVFCKYGKNFLNVCRTRFKPSESCLLFTVNNSSLNLLKSHSWNASLS